MAYTVQAAVVSGASYARGEVIYTRTTADGGLSEKGHFCLEDGCYYLDLSGETVVRLRSATDDGPKFWGWVLLLLRRGRRLRPLPVSCADDIGRADDGQTESCPHPGAHLKTV